MRPEAFARIALAVLVVGLVALGLVVVGGPGRGRMESRDETRLSDLHRVRTYVICVAKSGGGVLPDRLERLEICQQDIRFADPFTGEPYRYERLSPTAFRLCATFEDPERIQDRRWDALAKETGCLHETFDP